MRRRKYHVLNRPRLQGFDTEACHGNLLVVCSPRRAHEYRNGKNSRLRLLDWLWDEASQTNFFYNLTYDRDVLLKPFAKKMGRWSREVKQGPYTISLLGNKSFKLTRKGSHHAKRFFDISGFYADGERTLPLEETARLFLDEGKLPDVDRVRLGSEVEYYPAHRDDVIRYCKRDAELAMKLGRLLVKNLGETLNFWPSRFNSKASVAKAWLEVNHPELIRRKPRRWDLFRESYRGGIFLTRVLGRVEKVSEADIASAYGDSMRKIPRLDRLTRRTSNTYHPEAQFGAYRILIDYDGRLPLDARLRGKKRGRVRITYPTSHGMLRPYYAAKAEMDYFARTKRTFVVLMAVEWFGPFELQFPEIQTLLERCAALKEPAKTDMKAAVERMLFKTIINSIYGCLAESRHGETELTTWPLAAEISGRTRVAIWEEWDRLTAAGAIIVAVNTDSIRYVAPAETEPRTTHGIGLFESKFFRATVTHYQSGIAIIEEPGKPPLLRKRGKPLLTVELLKSAKGAVLGVPSHGVTHLFEALATKHVEDIGVFDDPNDPKDNKKIDLRSNLWALDFPLDLMNFETLNSRPVVGVSPDFDSVTRGKFERRIRTEVRGAKLRTDESPLSSKTLSSPARRHTEPSGSTHPQPRTPTPEPPTATFGTPSRHPDETPQEQPLART
jgi:hypothetical protein